MAIHTEKYLVNGFDCSNIRNRNEPRVVKSIKKTLESLGNPDLPEKVITDIYALALNNLPARYTQTGSIVLRDPVRGDDIDAVVSDAFQRVLKNPKL